MVILSALFGSREPKTVNGVTLQPIPQPPPLPLIGNLHQLDRKVPVHTTYRYWKQYGGIFTLQVPGQQIIVVSSYELFKEFTDEKRFHKAVKGVLQEARVLAGDGLFTAYTGEENWEIAHRLLMPAFSPMNIKNMFNDMMDLCQQLVLKWERFGPEAKIDPAKDFTRLAFDTIALCTMGYRINGFYNEGSDPFVEAMNYFLQGCQQRPNRPPILQPLWYEANAKWEASMRMMMKLVDKLIAHRKASEGRNDLLDLMLREVDPKTGKKLDDSNIRSQLITFLIAGHETSSGLMNFIMYFVLKNPRVYQGVRAEVDAVLGKEPIRPEHLGKLPYITAVIRETLRLQPTAPGFGVTPYKDEIVGGKYLIPKEMNCLIMLGNLHRDPAIWGDDADEFKPERLLDGKFEALPPKAWSPFGNGARACIGRDFAIQETKIAIATIFQRFDFYLDDPSYELRIKQSLTIRPEAFYFHAVPRKGMPPLMVGGISATSVNVSAQHANIDTSDGLNELKQGIRVLYGSNTGSSQSFAERIAFAAASKGFKATLATLDVAASNLPLPTNEPVIIITASFEGEPADNAIHFVNYVKNLSGQELKGIRYAVFGCGNKDWVNSYQSVPKLIDSLMEEHGAERIFTRGEGDASASDFFEAFETWEAGLWEILGTVYDVQGGDLGDKIRVKVDNLGDERAISLRQPEAKFARVTEARILTRHGAPVKIHLEFELPPNMTYRAGDYLTVLPMNPETSVRRVLAHFGWTMETQITIEAGGPTSLPTGKSVLLKEILSGYVELAQPATKRNLQTLIDAAPSSVKPELENLLASYREEIQMKRRSVFDLLVAYPSLNISFGTFLNMLPTMRVRQYSISSSPLWDPSRVTLTLSVVTAEALAGNGELFHGVASTFLSQLRRGDRVQVAVRPSAHVFSLPADISTPLVLFCAGSGIAPMRGFMQERAMQKAAGREVGRTLLFFGCRRPEEDFLYSDVELKEWQEIGAVEVRPAFSRAPEKSHGCKYVQHRILHDADDLKALFKQNAKFYTCGSMEVAAGIKDACISVLEQEYGDKEKAMEVFRKLQKERYATDIFG